MQFSVVQNQLLTPQSPDKSVFDLVLKSDINQQPIDEACFQPGDWLALSVENHSDVIDSVLGLLQLSGSELIELRRVGEVTTAEALQKHLEITQLNPAILNKLKRQYDLGDWADRQEMMAYAEGRDIIDLLEAFPSLKKMGTEFLGLLSPLAPRYYSIASAPNSAGTVSVLYKHVCYEREGRERQGVATRFLSVLKKGEMVVGEFKPNPTFKLPENPETPIMMIGAGTGVAPFIGFMQQRSQQEEVGQNVLFFGETHRDSSFLFEEQLLEWQQQDKLVLFTAFSRDQAEKQYIQDVLLQQKDQVIDLIRAGAVIYICGSQDRMALSVEKRLTEMFETEFDDEEISWQSLKEARRIQMDIY